MKKTLIISLKVIITIVYVLGELIVLTNIKLSGFNIGSWSVSAEQVQMFVKTTEDYLFWVGIVAGVYLIWKKRIRK